jgi:FAD/FMN-containing dehydrogenase
MARVASEATAFPHRDARFLFTILPSWAQPGDADAQRAWMTNFARAIEPLSTGGVYVNFLGDEGPERVRAAYGANYPRLVALKQKYDPNNFFSLNQNITPGGNA